MVHLSQKRTRETKSLTIMSENLCPYHAVRPGLPPLPKRIAALPLDERGYPIPFFVAYLDGKPDFRIGDPEKVLRCVHENLCWTCGQPLGRFTTFPVGPMCVITGTAPEPPEHLDCAIWSVQACPFLSKPNMVRREDEISEATAGNGAGIMILRNPGAICVWTTLKFTIFPDHNRKPLWNIGEPSAYSWWSQGRAATRLEVLTSIRTGLPALEELALAEGPEACGDLLKCVERAMAFLPPK